MSDVERGFWFLVFFFLVKNERKFAKVVQVDWKAWSLVYIIYSSPFAACSFFHSRSDPSWEVVSRAEMFFFFFFLDKRMNAAMSFTTLSPTMCLLLVNRDCGKKQDT